MIKNTILLTGLLFVSCEPTPEEPSVSPLAQVDSATYRMAVETCERITDEMYRNDCFNTLSKVLSCDRVRRNGNGLGFANCVTVAVSSDN